MSRKILTINTGSSSLKYALFAGGAGGMKLASGLIEVKRDHQAALKLVLGLLQQEGLIDDLAEIKAVGHRFVHGGEKYLQPLLVNKKELAELGRLNELAPLHNPYNLLGLKLMTKLLPQAKQVAVFDTAFHASLPEKAYRYAIPQEWYKRYGIRRYGFHGLNCQAVLANLPAAWRRRKIIICHLGNGCSITAVKQGKGIDTSMGFTPLEGLVMGTRSGDLDPAIIPYLAKQSSLQRVMEQLEKESGLLGLSGRSNDMRVLQQRKDKQSKLARAVFAYRLVKYIGAYTAALGGVEIIVFSGGIGEYDWEIRKQVIADLAYLGLKLDEQKNKQNQTVISRRGSRVKLMVMPADEAMVIAREVRNLLG